MCTIPGHKACVRRLSRNRKASKPVSPKHRYLVGDAYPYTSVFENT